MKLSRVNGTSSKQGYQIWYFILSFLLVLSLFLSITTVAHSLEAKHIILMIADGRGPQHNAATNDYTGSVPAYQSDPQWAHYWMSTFPYGGSYDASQAWTNFNYVLGGATDSAAAASAMYSGIKTNIGRASVSYDGSERFYTIGEKAKSLGKGTGVVTTVPISDATPGVFCAHNDSRANTYAIADECLFGDPNTTGTIANDPKYGGGHGSTPPTIDVLIGDGSYASSGGYSGFVNDAIRNKLTSESGQTGKHVFVKRETGVDGGDALLTVANDPNTLKLAGLFDYSTYSTENPTLAESAQAALAVLQKNSYGFVLVIEGGAVDWGGHANDMGLMIGELMDFNEAVDAVIDWVNTNDSEWANTLLIVTSDHECGYLTPGPGIFQDQPLGEVSADTLALEKIIANSGGRRASWLDADSDSIIDSGEVIYWAWNSGVHTNTLVPLSTRGVGAELFDTYATSSDPVRGYYLDNINVFSTMAKMVGNQSPTAFIDSITPNPATTGQSVTFTGHGVDTDGTVTAYEWTSSINSTLSTNSTFSTSSLSAGTHTISLRVQDDDGAWSTPVTSSVTVTGGGEVQVTLAATYSFDVKNNGTKYYHDGNDWVGSTGNSVLRTVNRWDISSIDPSWDIVSVEVRFYTESKTGSPGTLSLTRYGTSHGEDNPQTDTGLAAYSKSAGSAYASLPEPSSGFWTNWVNLGSTAASDIEWCRTSSKLTWSLGLKASDTVEAGTTVAHVDFSEDNETNDAELRITYTQGSPSNLPPTAFIDSITPNPANSGQSVTFTGHGADTDGTIAAYEWTSSISGALSTATTFSTSSLSAGTHTISFRVQDDDGAWSTPVTSSVTVTGGGEVQVTLAATYSFDVKNNGTKYYHDGNDWVGSTGNSVLRTVNRWDISSIDPSWDIVSVEVRFYTESKTGSPGTLSLTRYGTSHGEDNPQTDTGLAAYSKIAGSAYASLPEPSSGSWTNWVNLGSTAASDIEWCRTSSKTTWSVGLKASDTVEAGTTVAHVDFSEDNETNDAELRITYTQGSPSNLPPTAFIDSITPNPANSGQSVTFTGHGADTDGTIAAYEWTSSISGALSTATTFSTSSLSAGTHTISFRVQDDDGAWSTPVTSSVTVTGGGEVQVTLAATYSFDVKNNGTKYYHDGNDWVGSTGNSVLRTVNRWDISSIDPSWDIVSVEVRFYTESKTGSPGTLSLTRYGTSHGEDNPQTDTGLAAYSKIAGSAYASLPEPSSGSWTNWVNLGSTAASDIEWCRTSSKTTWSVGLKASDTVEAGTTVAHVDFSEDNETNDAELRITYTLVGS